MLVEDEDDFDSDNYYEDSPVRASSQIQTKAREAGVGLVSAATFYIGRSLKAEFFLGYADLEVEQIREGVRRLAQSLI